MYLKFGKVLVSLSAGSLTLCTGSHVALSSSMIPVLIDEGILVQSFEVAAWLGQILILNDKTIPQKQNNDQCRGIYDSGGIYPLSKYVPNKILNGMLRGV